MMDRRSTQMEIDHGALEAGGEQVLTLALARAMGEMAGIMARRDYPAIAADVRVKIVVDATLPGWGMCKEESGSGRIIWTSDTLEARHAVPVLGLWRIGALCESHDLVADVVASMRVVNAGTIRDPDLQLIVTMFELDGQGRKWVRPGTDTVATVEVSRKAFMPEWWQPDLKKLEVVAQGDLPGYLIV